MKLGYVAAVDPARRVLLGRMEVFVDLEAARAAMPRPPDVESDDVVAWAGFDERDAAALFAAEPDHAADLAELRAGAEGAIWTLFYPRGDRG